LLAAALSTSAQAVTRHHHQHHHAHHASAARHLRHVAWHPLFAGSHEMLVRQNQHLDLLELPRINNDAELLQLEEQRELVPVANSRSLMVAPNLPENRRYCRPWTRDFLEDLGEAYYSEFHQPIVATSLVRTVDQQRRLRRVNGNAAPQEGDTASTHLTGVTVDLLKRGMTRQQHKWLEDYFLQLKDAGLVEPIEERRQPVFHVVVFDGYSDYHDEQQEKLDDNAAPLPTPDDRRASTPDDLHDAPGVAPARTASVQ
jgi:hypothetical protein